MDNKIDKQSPFGQYEWVTVTFPDADTDVVIPYTRLRPESYEDVRWIDVAQRGSPPTVIVSVDGAGVSSEDVTTITGEVPIVYRAVDQNARAFGPGYVVLRCTVGQYVARLLLFVERNEG